MEKVFLFTYSLLPSMYISQSSRPYSNISSNAFLLIEENLFSTKLKSRFGSSFGYNKLIGLNSLKSGSASKLFPDSISKLRCTKFLTERFFFIKKKGFMRPLSSIPLFVILFLNKNLLPSRISFFIFLTLGFIEFFS